MRFSPLAFGLFISLTACRPIGVKTQTILDNDQIFESLDGSIRSGTLNEAQLVDLLKKFGFIKVLDEATEKRFEKPTGGYGSLRVLTTLSEGTWSVNLMWYPDADKPIKLAESLITALTAKTSFPSVGHPDQLELLVENDTELKFTYNFYFVIRLDGTLTTSIVSAHFHK
jgi:hypothetical protein